MKPYWLLAVCVSACLFAHAQFRPNSSSGSPLDFSFASSESSYIRNNNFMGLKSDAVLNYRYSAPWYTFWPGAGGHSYWVGSTITQSFNQGKFGTIYTYDNLGNLRYASPFIDIAGKNKRGLKLLLPTFNQRMFQSR